MDGSTSVVMAVTSRYIMVANAGDSRAVLMDGDDPTQSLLRDEDDGHVNVADGVSGGWLCRWRMRRMRRMVRSRMMSMARRRRMSRMMVRSMEGAVDEEVEEDDYGGDAGQYDTRDVSGDDT
jgi:hypothetical protein